MSNYDVSITLTAVDRTGAIGTAQSRFNNALDDMQSRSQSTFARIQEHWMALTAALAGAFILALQAWNVAKISAQFEQSRAAFRGMVQGMGHDADVVFARIREASAGLVDDKRLTEAASRAIAMGIPVERLGELMLIARAKSRDMGIATTQAFDDITRGIGRASPMLLDNLGLVINLNEANEAMAKSLGKTVEQLTAKERRTAILNATIDAGQGSLARHNLAILTTYERMQRLEATVQNLQLVLGSILIRATAAAIGSFQSLISVVSFLSAVVLSARADLATLTNFLRLTRDDYQGLREDADAAYRAAIEFAQKARDNYAAMAATSEDVAVAMRQVKDETTDTAMAMETAAQATDKWNEAARRLERSIALIGLEGFEAQRAKLGFKVEDLRREFGAQPLIQRYFDAGLFHIQQQEIEELNEAARRVEAERQAEEARVLAAAYEARTLLEHNLTTVMMTERERRFYDIERWGQEQLLLDQQALASFSDFKSQEFEIHAATERKKGQVAREEQHKAAEAEMAIRRSVFNLSISLLQLLGARHKAAAVLGIAIATAMEARRAWQATVTASILAFSSQVVPGLPWTLAAGARAAAAVRVWGMAQVAMIGAKGALRIADVLSPPAAAEAGGAVGGGIVERAHSPAALVGAAAADAEAAIRQPRPLVVNIVIHGHNVDHDRFAREIVPAVAKAIEDGAR